MKPKTEKSLGEKQKIRARGDKINKKIKIMNGDNETRQHVRIRNG